jgi:uncharacterized protein
MTISSIRAIDSHAHFGRYVHADPLISEFSSGEAAEVVRRAAAVGIEWTIASPLSGLLPRGRTVEVAPANEQAFREVPRVPGLLQYVIVNPLQPATYAQARRMLEAPWCVGIKIHPEEHAYRIADHGEELFAFFEETGAPVMTHSGCPNSLPADFVPFANRHPGARVMLAHLGNGNGDNNRVDLQVRAVQAAKHGNLWVDTSSARSILPGLIEWGVRELGAERVLFGSDTPLYDVAMHRTRIELAGIPDKAKHLILRDNAISFFRLESLPAPGAWVQA